MPEYFLPTSFVDTFQMWSRAVTIIVLAVSAYLIYQYFSKESFTVPGPAPIITTPMPYGPAVTAPGGPNTPSVAPPMYKGTPRASEEVEANDPYRETHEDAYAEENLRHPERSYSPGIYGNSTQIAQASGVANQRVAGSGNAFQQFAPEFASTGGFVDGDIAPHEEESSFYSAF